MLTGTLATSAATADQVIATKTIGSNKQSRVMGFDVSARLTTFASTATLFGTASLEIGGVKVATVDLAGPGIDKARVEIPSQFAGQGGVVRVVCTPAVATAMTWRANVFEYEE